MKKKNSYTNSVLSMLFIMSIALSSCEKDLFDDDGPHHGKHKKEHHGCQKEEDERIIVLPTSASNNTSSRDSVIDPNAKSTLR